MDKIKAKILEKDGENLKVRLSNGEEIWLEDDTGIETENIGDAFRLSLLVIPGRMKSNIPHDIKEEKGLNSRGEFSCELIAEVTGYDVEDKWPEAKSGLGYPLVELDIGIGKLVVAHENVFPVKEKQPYHEKGVKWKMTARKLIIKKAGKAS